MIFVDTSAFVALSVASDSFHASAVDWKNEQTMFKFVTSNNAVLESLGWIRYKRGKVAAVRAGEGIFGGDISIERVTADDEREAWELFQKTEGRGVSMVDCTTVVVMKRLKIKEVFSFDQDFAKFGLTVVPRFES